MALLEGGSASIAGIGTGFGDTLYCRPKFCAVFLCSAFCKLIPMIPMRIVQWPSLIPQNRRTQMTCLLTPNCCAHHHFSHSVLYCKPQCPKPPLHSGQSRKP